MDWGLLNGIGITVMALFGLLMLWNSHEKGRKTGGRGQGQASGQESREQRGRAQ